MALLNFEDTAKDILAKLQKTKWKYDYVKSSLNGSRSFEELFAVILDLEESYELLVQSLVSSDKDEGHADKLRKNGTDFYKKKEYIDALDRYNLSILHAPHPVIRNNKESVSSNSECDMYSIPRIAPDKYGGVCSDGSKALAMGYANRSAVLIKMQMYDKCLRDIDLALKYGYPEAFRKILEDRRLKCLKAQETQSAQQDVQGQSPTPLRQGTDTLANDLLRLSLVSGNQELLAVVLNTDFKEAENKAWKNMLAVTEVEPPTLTEPNAKIPSLSSGLKVSYQPSKGRCVIATRNIRPGEVLAVERAYCVSLHECSLLAHCSACLCFCMVPLPCPGCSKVIFCSETCRTKYLEEDHWLECAIRPSIIALGLQNRNIAYKLLKNFSYHQLLNMLNELQMEKLENPETFGFDKNGVYSSTSYQAVHYLQTNKENIKFESLFSACLLAFVFTKLLHLSKRFFVDDCGQPLQPTREDLVTTGAVILANILKIHNNARIIHNYKLETPIASAIFPALSLVNHDCSPSAYAYHRGRMRILRSLKPILPGEEVTLCYAMHFHEQEREGRRKTLESYGISCKCEACERRWPMFSKLPIYEVKSNVAVSRQEKTQILQRISNAVVLSHKVRNKLINDEQVAKEDFDALCEATEMMYNYVFDPCQNICNLQLALMLSFHAGF